MEEALLDCALAAARAAADIHRRYLGRVALEEWSEKGVADFVTHVDREAEDTIVAEIRRRFPAHAILAEESAGEAAPPGSAEWLWIVDPLDGTTNFLHGYPAYAASVAVARRGELVAAVVASSATGEEWWAVRGGGAFHDGRPVRVSQLTDLRLALIGTGFPFKAIDRLPPYLRQFDAVLRRSAGIRRAGSAALDLCHVASGYFDGFWELLLAPWDIAAGTLIVREAGGVVTALDGRSDVLDGHGAVLAGNPAIHAELGAVLASAS
ncbi:MAG TPA: inositol monophosphatase family protein [Longimicrobiales bacterium]